MTDRKSAVKTFLLSANPDNSMHKQAVERAILFLYDRQTASEQISKTTNVTNGKGLNSCDAEFYTSLACGIRKYGGLSPGQIRAVLPRRKDDGKISLGIAKYSGQIAEMPERG